MKPLQIVTVSNYLYEDKTKFQLRILKNYRIEKTSEEQKQP